MAGGSNADEAGLEETPTYAVAATTFLFILVSLIVEGGINKTEQFLKKKNQKPLRKVLVKMKEELMLLGFVSLLLTVLQNSVVKICMPAEFAKHMLPCRRHHLSSEAAAPPAPPVSKVGRRILQSSFPQETMDIGAQRNLMAENVTSTDSAERGHCASKGKVPFISGEVLHQLHIFIFVLAVTHVCYSLVTVLLGFARLQRWRRWEQETKIDGYDGNLDLERRYRRILESENHHRNAITAFFDRNFSHPCDKYPVSIWIACFFRQFFSSVSSQDYLIFRVRFMNNHSLAEPFNFWDYVIRTMQEEFQRVIGISWWLWLFVTVFLLLGVHGYNTYFWLAFLPAIIVLVIGTTQQHVISTLAKQVKKHTADVMEAENSPDGGSLRFSAETDIAPAFTSTDKLFWFDNPQLLLKLLHFVMFQNSFEIAVFFWLLVEFGWNNCILGNHTLLIIRVLVGVATQLLASYSTLPIYALVTQMGSRMKGTVFTKDVFRGLQDWKKKAKRITLKRMQDEEEEPDTTADTAESSTQASEQVHQPVELPIIPPEAGPSEQEPPRVPNPELVQRFQRMYGKIRAMQKLKLAGTLMESGSGNPFSQDSMRTS